MNLETVVRIRRWDPTKQEVFVVDAKLGDIVRNPTNYHLVDLGFHLVNSIREDLELPLMDYRSIAPDGTCPACTGFGNIHKNCILR